MSEIQNFFFGTGYSSCSLRAAATLFLSMSTTVSSSTAFITFWQYYIGLRQGVLSWRASGNRQIPLSASDERAFANFRVKNVVFTGTHFCAVLSMVGERVFVNFRKFVN